jgi:hypothetical protein
VQPKQQGAETVAGLSSTYSVIVYVLAVSVTPSIGYCAIVVVVVVMAPVGVKAAITLSKLEEQELSRLGS